MKTTILIFALSFAVGASCASQALAADAKADRISQAKALFDANNMKSGRILVLISKDPKQGKAIAGVKGFRKLNKKRLQKSDLAGVRRVAVYEKHRDGSITVRDARMIKNGRIIFADGQDNRQQMTRNVRKPALKPAARVNRQSASEQQGSVIISSETQVPADEPVQVVQEDIVIDTSRAGSNDADGNEEIVYNEQVKKYREQKALEQEQSDVNLNDVDVFVIGGEVETSDWKSIEIPGEEECEEVSSDETWFSTLSATQADCGGSRASASFPGCETKYPATSSLDVAFRHSLSNYCYSCPKGYARSLNPDIRAEDACTRAIPASTSYGRAEKLGPVNNSKPHNKAFKDPRNGGEWWKCPNNRPRRTLHKVTSNKACATEEIVGEKLSKADFLGPVKNKKPSGAFVDPRNGGEYWKCPAGYNRTAAAVNDSKACSKTTASREDRKRASLRGTL